MFGRSFEDIGHSARFGQSKKTVLAMKGAKHDDSPLKNPIRRTNTIARRDSMAQPRPSGTLILDIDARLDSEDVRLEVNRCYPYVCPTLVRTHEAEEGDCHNTARLLVKLGTRKYVCSADEGSDELWNEVIERWIYNAFHKLGNQMKIYNRRQREIGGTELYFDAIELDLENGKLKVALRLDSNSDIPASSATFVSAVRAALNDGSLGEGVVRVQMPTNDSFAAQAEVAEATKAEREAEAAKAAEEAKAAEAAARAEAEAAADENFLESPELTEADSEPETAMTESELEAELEAKFGFPEADFAVDFTMWAVEYADGTVRTFDSSTGKFQD